MTISRVGDVGTSGNATTASVVIPSGAASGHAAIANLIVHDELATVTVPSGWSAIAGIGTAPPYSFPASLPVAQAIIMGKVLQNGDPGATFAPGWGATKRFALTLGVWSGTDTSSPFAYTGTPSKWVNPAATTHTTPTIANVVEANCTAVYLIGDCGSPASTGFSIDQGTMQTNTGSYQVGGVAGSASTGFADQAIATGALAARTFTGTASTYAGYTQTVVLKPSTSTTATAAGFMPDQLFNKAMAALIATGTVKFRLLNTSYAIDLSNHNFWADVSGHEVANGNGYTTGGLTVSDLTYNYDGTSHICKISGGTKSFTPSAGQTLVSRYGCFVVDTGNPATSAILAWLDSGGETDAQGALVFSPDATYGWIGSDRPASG